MMEREKFLKRKVWKRKRCAKLFSSYLNVIFSPVMSSFPSLWLLPRLTDKCVLSCASYQSLIINFQDTTLRPFPPSFLTSTGERDVEGVQAALATLSSLEDVKKGLRDGSLTLPVKLQQLLLWVFGGGLRLRSLSKPEAERVMTMPGRVSDKSRSHPQPHVVLEVQGPGLSNWEERVATEPSLWAFHGSRLDNFHSILNFGLQQHRNKVSLFGEGIYLARDLGVCLAYSHRGQVGHGQWLTRTTTNIIFRPGRKVLLAIVYQP